MPVIAKRPAVIVESVADDGGPGAAIAGSSLAVAERVRLIAERAAAIIRWSRVDPRVPTTDTTTMRSIGSRQLVAYRFKLRVAHSAAARKPASLTGARMG